MKKFTVVLAAMAMMMTTAAFAAEDGGAIFKAKCAACHGADASGKMGPAIKGSTKVSDVLTNGGLKGPHAKPIAGLSADQVSAVASYVGGLK